MRKSVAWVVVLIATFNNISVAEEPVVDLETLGLTGFVECDSQEAAEVRGQGFAAVLGESRTASWVPGFGGYLPNGGSGYAATHIAALGDHRANLFHSSHNLMEFDFSALDNPSYSYGPANQIMGHIGLGSTGRAQSSAR